METLPVEYSVNHKGLHYSSIILYYLFKSEEL